MRTQDELRFYVKLLKVQGVISSYKEIAEDYLDCSYRGFLNWLNNQYDYGMEKVKQLDDIIDDLMLPM